MGVSLKLSVLLDFFDYDDDGCYCVWSTRALAIRRRFLLMLSRVGLAEEFSNLSFWSTLFNCEIRLSIGVSFCIYSE